MTAVGRVVTALPTLFRVAFAEMIAYRASFLIWILTATWPFIMLFVWDTVASEGPVGRFDQLEFARYFTATLIVRQLTAAWVVWDLNEQIRTGRFSTALLKPMHPLVWPAIEGWAGMPFRAAILVPLVAIVAFFRPGMGIPIAMDHVPLLLMALVLGALLNYLMQASFGLLALWLEQSLGVFNVCFSLQQIFSGYIMPVELMPGWLPDVVVYTPFYAILGGPIEILAGLRTGGDAFFVLAVQAVWVVIAAVVLRVVWARGLKRYGAFGS